MTSANSTVSPPGIAPTAAPTSPASATFGVTDIGLLVMAIIWGVNYSVVKYGLRTLAPLTFTAVRMSIATVILIGLAAAMRDTPRPSRADIRGLLGLGLIGNGFYQLLFVIGLSRTRAGIAALVIAASPAWVAIISRLLGRETVTLRGWVGIALQLVGVATVVLSTNVLDAPSSALLGTFYIVCGSILWSLYTVLLQPYTTRVHPLQLSAITIVSGTLLLVALAAPDLLRLDFRTVERSAWAAVAYSAILAMIIAYLLYYRGIRELGPSRTAAYANLQPIVAILVALLLLGEAPSAWQWVGTALIMCGLLLSRTAPVKSTAVAGEICTG